MVVRKRGLALFEFLETSAEFTFLYFNAQYRENYPFTKMLLWAGYSLLLSKVRSLGPFASSPRLQV